MHLVKTEMGLQVRSHGERVNRELAPLPAACVRDHPRGGYTIATNIRGGAWAYHGQFATHNQAERVLCAKYGT